MARIVGGTRPIERMDTLLPDELHFMSIVNGL